jgi:hypothetical protein
MLGFYVIRLLDLENHLKLQILPVNYCYNKITLGTEVI